jgi:hypothetical protein
MAEIFFSDFLIKTSYIIFSRKNFSTITVPPLVKVNLPLIKGRILQQEGRQGGVRLTPSFNDT